jgi:hypothetical protein
MTRVSSVDVQQPRRLLWTFLSAVRITRHHTRRKVLQKDLVELINRVT